MVLQKEDTMHRTDESVVAKKKRKPLSWMTSNRFRWIFQVVFLIITIYIGWKFYLFVVFMNTARVTGYWHNNITLQEYMYRIADINNPKYQHKQGKFEVE
ncbi:MAG: 4Fe-4S ferredoxin iron-sulfur binding protein [Candidatus Scalindua rubra]|uniref:4Fe-4S ferredoxin iron-sulfur binding protein n=1 Tax=Candidatus Scalindua rubra TaxID=1872076 RepID=A0A1E3XCI2_9BACT|nr:MAG: 4Fe-4S ferredoxin iron-sulfur binding protein [Candidatus Scalindua rubra]